MEGGDIRKDFWNDVGVKQEETPAPATTPPGAATNPTTLPPTEIALPAELTDAQVLQLLSKRNIHVTSLEDLKPKKTEAEINAENAQRRDLAVAHGLQNGKIKQDEYDAAVAATSDKQAFLFQEFSAARKADNPEITDDEILDDWNEYTLSHLADTDFKRKQRLQELNELADVKLQKKFANFYNLDKDFSLHEQNQNQTLAFKEKVKASLPVYQKDVETVLSGLRSRKILIEDTQNPANNVEIELTFSDEDLNELKEAYLSDTQIVSRIQKGYTVEALNEEANMFLVNKHFGRLVSKAAKDYNSKQQDTYLAGRHGIVPKRELFIADGSDPANVKTQFWSDVLQPVQQTTPAAPVVAPK